MNITRALASGRLKLTQNGDSPVEWWITLDGNRVIGFCGNGARERAEQHFQEMAGAVRPDRSHDTHDAGGVADGGLRW
jgi:hypothetical protein